MNLQQATAHRRRRRGAVLPLIALVVVILLGVLAIVFDLGLVVVHRGQLQNAADAAALAGASALGTDNLILRADRVNQASDMANARRLAVQFAQANSMNLNGTVQVVLHRGSDVSGGYLSNPSDLSQPLSTSGLINSIQVWTYADQSHSGNIALFFAPVLGFNSSSVQMSATATVQLYTIAGPRAIPGYISPVLPITMSYADWQAMVTNQTGLDNYRYDPNSNKMLPGSDGLQEQELYPGDDTSSSNNGVLQLGTGSQSDSVLQGQIYPGPTADQLIAQWPPSGTPTWSAQHTLTMGADPGWRAITFDSLAQVAASGLPRLIPINDGTPPGNGAKGSYTIVGFAAVRVVTSSKGGKNGGNAWVQPAVINDPTLVPSNILAGPGEGGIPVVRLTR